MQWTFPLNKQAGNRGDPIKVTKLLPSSKCEAIVEDCNKLEKEQGTIRGNRSVETDIRNSDIAWVPFPHQDQSYAYVYEDIQDFAVYCNDKFYNFDIQGIGEQIQYGSYSEKQHYDWHMDVGDDSMSIRKFSISVALTDRQDYEGGDMLFKTGTSNTKIELDIGDAVIFPSWMLHKVEPITKGIRNSLVVWVTGPPYR